jgi:hypothetical protein
MNDDMPYRLIRMCDRCDCPIMRTELTDAQLVALRDALRFVATREQFTGAELLNRMIEEYAAARLLLADIVRDHEGEVPASIYEHARRLIHA